MSQPVIKDLKNSRLQNIEKKYPGGLAQLRTDWQNALTFATAKPILTFLFKLLLGL